MLMSFWKLIWGLSSTVFFSLSLDVSYELSQLDGYIKDALMEGSRQTVVKSGLHVSIELCLRFSWL